MKISLEKAVELQCHIASGMLNTSMPLQMIPYETKTLFNQICIENNVQVGYDADLIKLKNNYREALNLLNDGLKVYIQHCPPGCSSFGTETHSFLSNQGELYE